MYLGGVEPGSFTDYFTYLPKTNSLYITLLFW